MTIEEANLRLITASAAFTKIHAKLDDECLNIPVYDVNAEGEKGAIAKAWNALRVTCDYLPQESTEILALLREQISPAGTQAGINYHQSEVIKILNLRKSAIIDGMRAIRPYGSEAQRQNIDRLLLAFG